MLESLRQVDTPSPGPPRSYKRQSKNETLCDERSQTTGLKTWTRKLSEESRQKKSRPGPHVENYQVTVWNAFLNNICGASATQWSNHHNQPRQSQRLHEGIRSSQPPTLQQRREEPHPTAEIHVEIPDCRRKLLRCLEIGGAR